MAKSRSDGDRVTEHRQHMRVVKGPEKNIESQMVRV
jgi:hypothetical protein